MTEEKPNLELERKQWLKRVRSEVHWYYADLRDRELAKVLPRAQEMFDAEVSKGQKKPKELDTGSVFQGGE